MLTRPNDDPLSAEFEVELVEAVEPTTKPSQPPAPPKIKDYKLPEPILVYRGKVGNRRTWDEVRKEDGSFWNGEDIAKVVSSGNGAGVDVYINMDAEVLHEFLRRQRLSDKKQDFVKRSWEAAIFLNSLVIYNDLAKSEKGDIVPDIMRSISKIVLDLMCNDAFLKELEKSE
jgi:hypothetical protein